MANLATTLFAVTSAIASGLAFGQGTPTPAPNFTLTISLREPNAGFPKNTQIINVRETNISKEIIRQSACTAFGALYKLDVVYNGVVLQEEPDARRERREYAEAVEAGKEPGLCEGSSPVRATKPGEYWDETLPYEAKKPGTYEFTVEEKSFPEGGGDGVVVKSNTLTIAVPPPAPQTKGKSL
jgi:hypothetical protein